MRRYLYGKWTEPSDSFLESQYEVYVEDYNGEDDVNEGDESDRTGPLAFDEWLYHYEDSIVDSWAWYVTPDYD